jgi:hypothetical protein
MNNTEKCKSRSHEFYLINKEIQNTKRVMRRAENPNKIKAESAAYYQRNKDRISVRQKEYRAKDPKKTQAQQAANRASHPNRNIEWKRLHPESNRIRCHNRKARKKENGGNYQRIL